MFRLWSDFQAFFMMQNLWQNFNRENRRSKERISCSCSRDIYLKNRRKFLGWRRNCVLVIMYQDSWIMQMQEIARIRKTFYAKKLEEMSLIQITRRRTKYLPIFFLNQQWRDTKNGWILSILCIKVERHDWKNNSR